MIDQLQTNFSDWRSVLTLHGEQVGMINLKELVRRQAVQIGIPDQQIHTLNLCTICRPKQFYSYRREGQVHGSMVSGVVLS